ncbi:MAG: DUF1501 domain-containing protein [Verrucomicrobiales bacterium]
MTCRNSFTTSNRRDFLRRTSAGFGWLALSGLLGESTRAAAAGAHGSPLAERAPHFAPKAKRVIFMFMQGGPSHLDMFDWKPALKKADGKGDGKNRLLAPQFDYKPRGKSGLMISDLWPELSKHADDLCLLNGCHTSNAAHPQATIAMHTGSVTFVRPSMGSWIVYGLGTANQDLPGFVTIDPANNLGGAQNYGSAFLPASFQGTRISTGARGIANIANPEMDAKEQRKHLDLVQEMNRGLLARTGANPEIEGVIESFELAYRMQTSVPNTLDLNKESAAVKEKYGIGSGGTDNFGKQCLMARRLAEKGVRFIQVTHRGWDQHNSLQSKLQQNCGAVDKPVAALISDLKERGMLEDTLLVWGGEFGRSPQAQDAKGTGRRHNNRGFSMWMAGGGVKGGLRYGATDETGGTAVEGKIGTHDLHATMLHLLGLNHEKLTYRYAGRDFRLTDVAGTVVDDIIA